MHYRNQMSMAKHCANWTLTVTGWVLEQLLVVLNNLSRLMVGNILRY